MGYNNKGMRKAQMASEGSSQQQVAFLLIWLFETKITSIILTHANANRDFKQNKAKF